MAQWTLACHMDEFLDGLLARVFCAAALCAVAATAKADVDGLGPGGGDSQYTWARATVPAAEDEMLDPELAEANSTCWFSWIPNYSN